MKPEDLVFDPYKLFAASAAAWIDMSRAMQDVMLRQMDAAASRKPFQPFWMQPGADLSDLAPPNVEEQMREAFHYAADLNLRGWEHAANMIAALPDWSHKAYKMPGSVLTDWFDQFRERAAAAQPANDFWAVGPDAESDADQPDLLDAPDGDADDLTALKGIGPKLSARLNELGVFHYRQIAAWTPRHGEWIDEQLAFKGRVEREAWVAQAKALEKEKAA
ncbi:MAG: hypothetical protein AAFX08_10160 [Pseudomonadota bacterium]